DQLPVEGAQDLVNAGRGALPVQGDGGVRRQLMDLLLPRAPAFRRLALLAAGALDEVIVRLGEAHGACQPAGASPAAWNVGHGYHGKRRGPGQAPPGRKAAGRLDVSAAGPAARRPARRTPARG